MPSLEVETARLRGQQHRRDEWMDCDCQLCQRYVPLYEELRAATKMIEEFEDVIVEIGLQLNNFKFEWLGCGGIRLEEEIRVHVEQTDFHGDPRLKRAG